MRFTPKDEKTLASENVLHPGVYDFEVATAKEKLSKAGNEMIVVDLKVYDDQGKTRFVRDYLMESFLPKLLYFCKEIGLRAKYDAGTLSSTDLEGKSGKVELAIKQNGDFPAKNTVKWYGVKEKKGATAPAKKSAPATESTPPADWEDDDQIPF